MQDALGLQLFGVLTPLEQVAHSVHGHVTLQLFSHTLNT